MVCIPLHLFSQVGDYLAFEYVGGGTKPPIAAASSRANSIVVGSSPSGPITAVRRSRIDGPEAFCGTRTLLRELSLMIRITG